MAQIKSIFLYIMALIVLLAPVIILGWIGLTLLSWPGLLLGVIVGGVIFVYSVNKVAAQDAEDGEAVEQVGESEPVHSGQPETR